MTEETKRKISIARTKHGCSAGRHELYAMWKSMRNRCNNSSSKNYPGYGGRGIKICKRWDDFLLFVSDMGPRPSKEHQIDRIDNNGHYEPSNCRWATRIENHNNKRNNRFIEFDGIRLSVTQWARVINIGPETLRRRLKHGYSILISLTLPITPPGKRLPLGRMMKKIHNDAQ